MAKNKQDKPVEQSKFEVTTGRRRKARENVHERFTKDHFQKERKAGAKVGALSILGSFGDGTCLSFQTRGPPNDPITERAPTLAPVFHSF